MNSVNLMGYVTGEIDLRYTANGNPVANFGIATNRRYRQGEEMKQEATFVDLVAFNRTAEIADTYLGKGRPVAIEGRLRYRTWETEGGAKRSSRGCGQPAASDARTARTATAVKALPRTSTEGVPEETPF